MAMGIPPGLPVPVAMREMRSRRVGSCCSCCVVEDVNVTRRPAPHDEENPSGIVDGEHGWIVVRVCGDVVVSSDTVTERGGRGNVGSEYKCEEEEEDDDKSRAFFSFSFKSSCCSGTIILPVTISHSQSAIPSGARASTAVCGEYTLIPCWASRSSDCCWGSLRVNDLRPRKMIGSSEAKRKDTPVS